MLDQDQKKRTRKKILLKVQIFFMKDENWFLMLLKVE